MLTHPPTSNCFQLDDLISVWRLNSDIVMRISDDMCGTLQQLAAEQQQMQQPQQHLQQPQHRQGSAVGAPVTAPVEPPAGLLSRVLTIEAMERSEAQARTLSNYTVGG